MPIMDGYEATAAIRKFEVTEQRAAIPIIAMIQITENGGSFMPIS